MVNKVILVGNLGKDPEIRYTSGGQAVCDLSVATSESFMDKQSGQRKQITEWHTVTIWGKQAEACAEHLSKGRLVYVEGSLKTESWEDKKSGEKKYRTKVNALNVRFLSTGGGKGGGKQEEREEDQGAGGGPDDIPF